MLDPEDPLVHTAVLGRAVEDFLESDVGKLLTGRFEEYARQAVEGLKKTAPWRRQRIAQLQLQARIADEFARIVVSAIRDGEAATQLLEEEGES